MIIVTHGNRKPWCRPLLIMELCHFFLCVFLIEWVLAVHARYSGGVRLGNLMLDSHLLGPHTSSTPDYCITDPSRKSSWYWHNTCSLSGNFPRDHILLLGLMSAEVSHSWRCVDNVAMAMWKKTAVHQGHRSVCFLRWPHQIFIICILFWSFTFRKSSGRV